MILKKAPAIYNKGCNRVITKFAFKPIRLKTMACLNPETLDYIPEIIGDLIWLERYVETYRHDGKDWVFIKSERFSNFVLNKLKE
jgi:hypothetical protein